MLKWRTSLPGRNQARLFSVRGFARKLKPRQQFHQQEDNYVDNQDEHAFLPLDAVIKVFTVHTQPRFALPWQRAPQERSSGTGFIIGGNKILTNAHCVEYSSQVQVKRRGSDDKFIAQVEAFGPECDLALLTVQEEEFWRSDDIVHFARRIPHFGSKAFCAGYPVGGETISVTSGVVSRVEVMEYTNADTDLLGVQIDAAINDGNSGGPAFNARGECVGVAFQSMGASDAENVGYVIPVPVVEHFLSDISKHGKYKGFPSLGISVQCLENPTLRKAVGMGGHQKGVLVRNVAPTSCVHNLDFVFVVLVKKGDVVLEIDGHHVGNDGTFTFRQHERLACSWIIASRSFGDEVSIRLLRDGVELEIGAVLAPTTQLIPQHLHAGHGANSRADPKYLVVAGAVFVELSVPYLEAQFGNYWEYDAPTELIAAFEKQQASDAEHKIVVLAKVLAHSRTLGYDDMEHLILKSVDGGNVSNLAHLAQIIHNDQTNSKNEFCCLELSESNQMVFEWDKIIQTTKEVCEEHGISSPIAL